MAATMTAPNLQRLTVPEIEFSYDSNGIISIIDDLVERVMSAHMKSSAAFEAAQSLELEESVVYFPAEADAAQEAAA
jgi:hypothetical protein